MWVVPIKGDVVRTSDDTEFTVEAYSNFKGKGPCVYVEHTGGDKTLPIYFFDIESVNGIKVEFNNQSKIMNAMGYMKRKQHLPQKHDTITVADYGVGEESDDKEPKTKKVKVNELKLHNRNLGLSRGLLIIADDDEVYSLKDIITIKRVSGDSYFDATKFQKIYTDYLGYREKRK